MIWNPETVDTEESGNGDDQTNDEGDKKPEATMKGIAKEPVQRPKKGRNLLQYTYLLYMRRRETREKATFR